MPTLTWLGKDAVVDHHRKVPLRLLDDVPALAIPGRADAPTHTLIEGDNLHALKALLPRYRGRVKCIYIDPPYNTGNEGWVYNDNVNSPSMRDWLAKEVGRDDLSRHDKWLCLMYPRLVLMRELLAVEGVIWASIDDNEAANLRHLMDEVFGPDNFVATIVWQKKYSSASDHKTIAPMHDFIIVFQRSSLWKRRLIARTAEKDRQYKFADDGGSYRVSDYTCNKTAEERPNLYYPIFQKNTQEQIWPKRSRVWAYSPEQHEINESKGLVTWGRDGKGKVPGFKRYKSSLRAGDGIVPNTWWTFDEVGHTDEAKKELRSLLVDTSTAVDFFTPKPTALIKRIIQISAGKNDIILDAFAGSGTTGQAVMDLNVCDEGKRECVLIQLGRDQTDGPNIAQAITRERLVRVSQGYTNAKGESVPGLNQAWRYQRLGEPFTNAYGMPRTDLPFARLAPIVFFHATTESMLMPTTTSERAFLGTSAQNVGVYLLYNGDMDDKDARSRNVLTTHMLEKLHPHRGARIVYGAACRVEDAILKKHRITFRQYPQALSQVAS